MRRLFRLLLDGLLPPRCIACNTMLAGERGPFCTPCDVTLLPMESACLTCGRPFGASGPARRCGPCEKSGPPFDRAWWGHEHGGALRDAIHRFKYDRESRLAAPLAATFAPPPGDPRDWDVVVPVPLHRSRLRRRGFNQSALIARRVSCALRRDAGCRVLERTRATRPQVGLSATDRADNVRGAFAVRQPCRGARVLLVDDVVTTGATLAECARILRGAGAASVDAWSVARGT